MTDRALPATKATLWVEFTLLFIAAPLMFWAMMDYVKPIPVLLGVTVIGIFLLTRTPGFSWRSLVDFKGLWPHLGLIAWLSVLMAAVIIATTLLYDPDRWLGIWRERPWLLPLIWLLYPIFSVLPQELLYRSLFFERYEGLFSSTRMAVLVNGAAFALVHVFLQWTVTLVLTFLGGILFGWVYAKTRNFPAVFILHWLAGGFAFTTGIGWYFYHGSRMAGGG